MAILLPTYLIRMIFLHFILRVCGGEKVFSLIYGAKVPRLLNPSMEVIILTSEQPNDSHLDRILSHFNIPDGFVCAAASAGLHKLVQSLCGLQGERSVLRGELRLLHSQLEQKDQDRHSKVQAFQQQVTPIYPDPCRNTP